VRTLKLDEAKSPIEFSNLITLAFYDLLIEGKQLSDKETKKVKKATFETLSKLKVDRWRESCSIKAQVRNLIYEKILWLPSESYSDEEVDLKAVPAYQHIFANYQGGGKCVCQPDGVGNLLSDLRRLKR
jgi:type I restriction enzyme R subunit